MNSAALIFSDNEEQGKKLLAFRDPKETQLLLSQEALQSTLKETLPNSLDFFHGYFEKTPLLNLKVWAQIYSVLKPDGHVKVQFGSISQEDFNKLSNMLKANGFFNKDPLAGSMSNEILYAKPKPQGQSMVVKIEQKVETNNSDLKNKEVCGEFGYDKLMEVDASKKKWVFAASDDLLDEDELLKNESNYQPFENKAESCATKPKACKNCTCGRKEQENKEEAEKVQKDLETGNIKSSCGNCYLGDAFRCAGCPYRGLPAFKPGEKVTLDMGSEFKNVEKEESLKVNVTNDGKVKLN